jgi:hypothetical protein
MRLVPGSHRANAKHLFDVSDGAPADHARHRHSVCSLSGSSARRRQATVLRDGIECDNKDKRQDWVLRGFRQFDAPVCVIITYDRVLDGSDDTPFDCGAVATALVKCRLVSGTGRRDKQPGHHAITVVREHAGHSDNQVIMKSIALG